MGNKVVESVSLVEGQTDQFDKMVSQAKGRIDSLVKEQLHVDLLVKKLLGQDCGCTNSGDGVCQETSMENGHHIFTF
ncbi:hypothetical protein BgiBS90_035170 [Biomphalaria glabrata]|nr:hypothetical protein BgiBS90_035170 [Biomphalaria glabrata]